ncbi:C-type lectin domain family 9 member A-like [Crassostrea virginica]
MGAISGIFLLVFFGTTSASHTPDAQYLSFELTDGSVLTSPSLATSGVISSLSDASLVTCCMKCARIGQCAGIFSDSDSKHCKLYSFQNYTSMNIAGIQNFVKVISDCEKRGHILSSKFGLCFDLFTNQLPWNQSRETCQNDGGQLVMLDTVPKIEFMTDYISHLFPSATYWHVGASDETTEGDWRWPNGAPVTDLLSSSTNQSELELMDCSALNRKQTRVQIVWCEATRRRICEWPDLI